MGNQGVNVKLALISNVQLETFQIAIAIQSLGTNLEAVLAGVSGTSDMALNTLDGHEAAIHEGEILQALAHKLLNNSSSLGALDSNELVVINDLQVNIATLVLEGLEVSADMSEILVGTAGVRDDVKRVLVFADDGVVNDAAVLVGED
jgi:hypothetical protein